VEKLLQQGTTKICFSKCSKNLSQLWPTRFSKMCAELVESFGEEELYRFWKNVTADSTGEPKTSDLDDLLCFSGKSAECNRYRNPSKVKTEPKTISVLEEYRIFEVKNKKKFLAKYYFKKL